MAWDAKYNRRELKRGYFKSPEKSFKDYLRKHSEHERSDYIRQKVKKREDEKNERLQAIQDSAVEKVAESEEAKALTDILANMKIMKQNALAVAWMILKHKIKTAKENPDEVDIADIEKLLKIVKTELGEPSSISSAYNRSMNNKPKKLSIEEVEIIKDLWMNIAWYIESDE